MTDPTRIVQLHGDMFGREQIRELIRQLNESLADGGVIKVRKAPLDWVLIGLICCAVAMALSLAAAQAIFLRGSC